MSNNSIDKLDSVLSAFGTLQTIIATNNLITKVDLNLPNLKELDLSRNYLKKIPNLSEIPKLERLLLGFNEITSGFNELNSSRYLMVLDLSFNRINMSPADMKKFIENLQRIENLNSLKVYNNPFCDNIQQYEYYFISLIPSLKSLNNEAISDEQKFNISKTKSTTSGGV